MVKKEPAAFFFVGDDSRSKEKAIENLKSSILDAPSKDLDFKLFYGDEATARDILDCAATIPFSSAKRLIVIKDFGRMPRDDRRRIREYLKAPASSACIVVEAESDSELAEWGEIPGPVSVRHFDSREKTRGAGFVKSLLAAGAKRMDEEAIEALKEVCGNDPSTLEQEVAKLIAYAGEDDEITSRDVEEVVAKTLASHAFDIAGAIGGKDIERALKIVSGLLSAGRKAYEIVGILCWHMKRLAKAKALQARGETDNSIAGTLRIRAGERSEFFRQAARYRTEELKQKMEMLLEADFHLKRSRYDPALILEFALIRLCLT